MTIMTRPSLAYFGVLGYQVLNTWSVNLWSGCLGHWWMSMSLDGLVGHEIEGHSGPGEPRSCDLA